MEAGAEAREWARRKIRDTAAAPAELHIAAELGEEWIDVVLDGEEPLPADLLPAIRAALQGTPRGAAAGVAEGFQDAVDIAIPRREKTEDINRYPQLAFGNTFEPLLESAEGKVRLQCTRQTADAMRKGVTIRAEEIKAHAKKKQDAGSSDEEEPSDDDGGDSMRLGAGNSEGRDSKSGKAETKKWFVGCYGCGGDHRWTTCHRWTPSARRSDVPALAKKDTSPKCAQRRRRPRQPSSETTASRGSFSRTFWTTMKGRETENPAPRDRGRETTTATTIDNTEDAAGRRHTPKGRDPGAAHAVLAETGAETGAATRAETGAGNQARTAARNAAARRVTTRGGPGVETKGATEAGAAVKTAGPRPVTVTCGEHTSPKRRSPHMSHNGKGFCRRPGICSG